MKRRFVGKNARSAAAAVIGAAVVVLIGCQPAQDAQPGPEAARVNGVPISMAAVESAVAELGPPVRGTNEEPQKRALDALIMQRVYVNAALDEGIDREPDVRAAVEAARLKILAKAYVERRASDVPAPSPEAIRGYYDEHPELFAERRLYRLQEIAVEASPEQVAQVTQAYESITTLNDMVAWLDASGLRYSTNAGLRGAEEIAGDLLPVLARMSEGETVKVSTNTGITILQITGTQNAPLTLEQATGAISRYLTNARTAAAMQALTKDLMAKATVQFFPPFNQTASKPLQ